MKPPAYFEAIRRTAARRWDQVEADAELRNVWHLLFEQIQEPRHVLSELLQNADDAGATTATARIVDKTFVFTHNGHDFTKDEFQSLCRFGYSNKRTLRTIGFRGLGFKSTFSLGDTVQLLTPTLSVKFTSQRFTEPEWVRTRRQSEVTEVRVDLRNKVIEDVLKKSFGEWIENPVSLLFFHNLRNVKVAGRQLGWQEKGDGPVAGSQWVTQRGGSREKYLIFRSEPEDFPEDAVREIRKKRRTSDDPGDARFSYRIDVVLGAPGRLHVVLPTGVYPQLPFACNAPFVQDPARGKIEAPESSPTNKWLLERIGEFVGESLLSWVRTECLTAEERAQAYQLLPIPDDLEHQPDAACHDTVLEALGNTLEGESFVLNDVGEPVGSGECVSPPAALYEVWSPDQLSDVLSANSSPVSVLSRHVPEDGVEALEAWGAVAPMGPREIRAMLQTEGLPKPRHWSQLLTLWAFAAEHIRRGRYHGLDKLARIVPASGTKTLVAAEDIVRLSEKRLLQSDADWEFLSDYLLVMNPNWQRYLTRQKRELNGAGNDEERAQLVGQAYDVLELLQLDKASDVDVVINSVADRFFEAEECDNAECVQLAQIAAKLEAAVSGTFQFITRDDLRTSVYQGVIPDPNAELKDVVAEDWYHEHALSDMYFESFRSCTREEWDTWLSSGRAGMLEFVPILEKRLRFSSRSKLEAELHRRGVTGTLDYKYPTSNRFEGEDWDFGGLQWKDWQSKASSDEALWADVMIRIAAAGVEYWNEVLYAEVKHVAPRGGWVHPVTKDPIPASWIVRFRELPCLRDSHGKLRLPAELLCRTPATEPLLGVEDFVSAELDTKSAHPLLEALGVRTTPAGPRSLLDRLCALASADEPPLKELHKWYKRLDQVVSQCSTDELAEVRTAFSESRLIYTQEGGWARSNEVFLGRGDIGIPDAVVVHSDVADLALWHRIGVADRPTVDVVVDWLSSLDSGRELDREESERVRSLLSLYPIPIWQDCGHWMNLEREWVPTGDLEYALRLPTGMPLSSLFSTCKKSTADFRMLPREALSIALFAELPDLLARLELRPDVTGAAGGAVPPWLRELSRGLERVRFEDEALTERVRTVAGRLTKTTCVTVRELHATPYLSDVPAGTPTRMDVLWHAESLYLADRSKPRLVRSIAAELGRSFEHDGVVDAIKICYERSGEFVLEYLEENFVLDAEEVVSDSSKPQEPDAEELAGFDPLATTAVTGEATEADADEYDSESELVVSETTTSATTAVRSPKRASQSPAPKAQKPPLVARFAKLAGFSANGDGTYEHPNGDRLVECAGDLFPWVKYDQDGKPLAYYRFEEVCLSRTALSLDAPVWHLCDAHPDTHSLVVVDEAEAPVELSGRVLRRLVDEGTLTVHPETYRLVYESGT